MADKKIKKEFAETFSLDNKEVFAVGTWNDDTYTEKDLDAMVSAFSSLDFQPALKITHDKNKENDKVKVAQDLNPALGYVTKLFRRGKKLIANFSGIPKQVYESIQTGSYNRVSAEIGWNYKRNGANHHRALLAVSLLGNEIPAVADLETLNGFYAEQKVYTYTDNDKDQDIKTHCHEIGFDEQSRIPWEETQTQYIYYRKDPELFRNIVSESVDDGITKLKSNSTVVGYGFDKDKMSLDMAKRWLRERLTLFSDKNTESHSYDKGEKDMKKSADDKTKTNASPDVKKDHKDETEDMVALKKELAEAKEAKEASDKKLSDLENKGKETETKLSDLESKAAGSEELTKQLADVQAQLKTNTETTSVLLAENETIKEAARKEHIQKFIDRQKKAGKIVPAIEAKVFSVLFAAKDDAKVCKYKSGEADVEASVFNTLKAIFTEIPEMVSFKTLSEFTEETDDNPGMILNKKITEYREKHSVDHTVAYKAVCLANPELLQNSMNYTH